MAKPKADITIELSSNQGELLREFLKGRLDGIAKVAERLGMGRRPDDFRAEAVKLMAALTRGPSQVGAVEEPGEGPNEGEPDKPKKPGPAAKNPASPEEPKPRQGAQTTKAQEGPSTQGSVNSEPPAEGQGGQGGEGIKNAAADILGDLGK